MPHTCKLVESIPLSPPGIIVVRGPRQTGKSTFLRQYIQSSLSSGLPPENIGLIEAESLQSRQDLLGELQAFRKAHDGFDLILIDEITSLPSWWLALKIAADAGTLANSLVICTGSAAHDLHEQADLLPGRRGRRYPVDFELLPVRYADVCDHLSLDDYFLTGGFPWAINEYLKLNFIPSFVYELYTAWIKGTLIRQRHSVHTLAPMLGYIVERSGTGVSVANLSRDCGIGSNHTAESYLALLEESFVILVSRWSEPGSNVDAPRKNRKFFPADPFLFHLFCDFGHSPESMFFASLARRESPQIMGLLVESLVAAELRRSPTMLPLRYFLGRKEIDFVGAEVLEVKYQNNVDVREFEWMMSVVPKGMKATVVTKQTHGSLGNVRAVPLDEWLLEDRG
ncbi:MAG: ATP-binding protein [Chitinispirillaceae bacterium]|nr:ATP-binding protein [Chitinispirillaceae bacterium]